MRVSGIIINDNDHHHQQTTHTRRTYGPDYKHIIEDENWLLEKRGPTRGNRGT